MSGVRQDRRTRYTRMVLKESLMALMEQKDITKITIKELCQRADVNRSTFYAHYRDQYDLLRQIEDDILEEINVNLSGFDMEDRCGTFRILENIFCYIKDNSGFCRLLLSQKHVEAETVEYLYLYLVNGSIGVVQNWLRTGMRRSPSEMAELLLRLVNQGIAAFLGEREESGEATAWNG